MSNKPCQQINIPTTDNTNLPCNEYIDCSCVVMTALTGEVETYFSLNENPSLCEMSLNFALSIIDARTRIAFLESVEGGGGGIGVQVNSDWNSVSGISQILNKPTLATVATSGAYSDLTGAPVLSAVATSGLYSDLTGAPVLGTVATTDDYDDLLNKPSLSTVATTGNYSDLLGAPTLAAVATSGAYADISGTPTLVDIATSGLYSDLTGAPVLSAVATTGAYADISGTPALSTAGLSGNYDDLINKPILSTVATTNNYTDLTNKPALGTMAGQASADYTPTTLLAPVALSNSYNDLDNQPVFTTSWEEITGVQSDITLSGFNNDVGFTAYEEGVFTVRFNGAVSGSETLANQRYTRIGNQYTYYINSGLTNIDFPSFSGVIYLDQLPHAVQGRTGVEGATGVFSHGTTLTYTAADKTAIMAVAPDPNGIGLYFVSTAGLEDIIATDFADPSAFVGSITVFTIPTI